MKNKLKNIALSILPSWLFTFLIRTYHRFTANPEHKEYLDKLSTFTKPGFYPFKLDDVEFPIYLDPKNGCVDYDIFLKGNFEPGIIRLLRAKLTPKSTFIDIGANIGQHSLYAKHLCSCVLAFEPIKRLYNQMYKSWFNLFKYKVNLASLYQYNIGLGNENKELPIYEIPNNIGASSVLISKDRKQVETIQIRRLDDITINPMVDMVHVVMKIDVEGYEYEVLKGGIEFIDKNRPVIFLEYSPCLYDQVDPSIGDKIFNYLKGFNYNIYDIGQDGEKRILIEGNSQIEFGQVKQTNLLCVPIA